MRLTVLGSAASHAAAGQACAGHLVESGETSVLFDCGNGVIANLYQAIDPYTLDAVFLTHNHPDHYADIYSMQAMLRYAPQGPLPPLPLYAPESLFETMQLLLSDRGAREFREAFAFTPLVAGEPVRAGALEVTPVEVDHTDPTFALVARDDSSTLCYTSDTAPGARVQGAAHGADLLLAEATLPQAYAGASPHMTAGEAGALAHDAGASRLVLVHVWPTNDRTAMLDEAAAAYAGPIDIANELDTYEL